MTTVGGFLRTKKLIINELHTKQYIIAQPGKPNVKPFRGNSAGPLYLISDFADDNDKPTSGVNIINLLRSADGDKWEMWQFQDRVQTTPNQSGQTWGEGEWIRILPSYQSYVTSGKMTGRILTLGRGEGIGGIHDVVVSGMPLDQIITSSGNTSELFHYTKTGGSQGEHSNVNALPELYTLSLGNVLVDAKDGQSLRKGNTSITFSGDSFTNLQDTPNVYVKNRMIVVNQGANALVFGMETQSSIDTKTLLLGTSSDNLSNKTETISIGYTSGNLTDPGFMNKNITIGNNSFQNKVGNLNVCVGGDTMSTTIGALNNNIGLGYQSMNGCGSSNNNICIGDLSGAGAACNDSIFIGTQMGYNNLTNNKLAIGNSKDHPVLSGTMTNLISTSEIHIGARQLFLGAIPTTNQSSMIQDNQVWADGQSGMLKVGNVLPGTTYEISSGNTESGGNIILETKGVTTSNVSLSDSVYKYNLTGGHCTGTTLVLNRRDSTDVSITGVIGEENKFTDGSIDDQGILVINTFGGNTPNILAIGNIYKNRLQKGVTSPTNVLKLTSKDDTEIAISNLVHVSHKFENAFITTDGNISLINKTSNVTIQGDVYTGSVTNGYVDDTGLVFNRRSKPDIVIPNVLHTSNRITNQSTIGTDGNVTLVTEGVSTSNISIQGNVYDGVLTNATIYDRTLTVERQNKANVSIPGILSSDYRVMSGQITNNGDLVLSTKNKGNFDAVNVTTGCFSNVVLSGSELVINRKNMSPVIITNMPSSSISLTSGVTGMISVPDEYKHEIYVSGNTYRHQAIVHTYGTEFTGSSNKMVIDGVLTTNPDYANFVSYVGFEFQTTSKYPQDAYAINEISFVVDNGIQNYQPAHKTAKIFVSGSNDNTTWKNLNTPSYFMLDYTKMKTISTGYVEIFYPLTKNISNYKYYRISFIGFTLPTPQIGEIHFDYVKEYEFQYETTDHTFNSTVGYPWGEPSSIYTTSVFHNYTLAVNVQNRLALTLESTEPFAFHTPSSLIHSVLFTVNGVTTTLQIENINLTLDVQSKTVMFDFTPASKSDHTFSLNLKTHTGEILQGTSYDTGILSNEIYEYPSSINVSSGSGLPSPYVLVKDSECVLSCTFIGGDSFYSEDYSTLIGVFEYSTDGGSIFHPFGSGIIPNIDSSNNTMSFNFTALEPGQHMFRLKFVGAPYYTYTFNADVLVFPALVGTSLSDTLLPIGSTITFTSTFSNELFPNVTGNVLITPMGQTAVTASNISFSGTGFVYSMTVQHDTSHSALISLEIGSISQQYTWSGVFNQDNIITYPTIQSGLTLSSLPSTKYTVGFSQISKTFMFGSELDDFEMSADFQSTDNTHNGSVSFSRLGSSGTISFLANTNSGYVVSNLQLKHTADNEYLDISDSTYGFSIANTQFWTPPESVTLSTLVSLPAPFQVVVNKTCRIRLTFDGIDNFHSSSYVSLVTSIGFSTNSGSSYTSIDLPSANLSIHGSNKTIDLNFTASSTLDHLFRVVLKGEDGVNTSYYTTSILSNKIFSFPSILSTVKLPPYDTTEITVGQTISMESSFDSTIPSSIVGTISISEAGSTPVALSTSISGSKYSYSFVVNNDNDHSATITFAFGGVSNTYSWSAPGLLTAASDIYTFPNYVAYDGTANGYGTGNHLKEEEPSKLVLTFTGGDQLHSDTYSSQVSSIQYKTGSSGSLATVPTGDVTINSATGHETITVDNITATAVDDVYVYITLKASDGVVMTSPLVVTVPSSAVMAAILFENGGDVIFLPKFDMNADWYVAQNLTVDENTSAVYHNNLTVSNIYPEMNNTYQNDVTAISSTSKTSLRLYYSNATNRTFKFKKSSTNLRYLLFEKSSSTPAQVAAPLIIIKPQSNFYQQHNASTAMQNVYLDFVRTIHSSIFHYIVYTPELAIYNRYNNSQNFGIYLWDGPGCGGDGSRASLNKQYEINSTPRFVLPSTHYSYYSEKNKPVSFKFEAADQSRLMVYTYLFDHTVPFEKTAAALNNHMKIFKNGVQQTLYEANDVTTPINDSYLSAPNTPSYHAASTNWWYNGIMAVDAKRDGEAESSTQSLGNRKGSYEFGARDAHYASDTFTVGLAEYCTDWSRIAISDAIAVSEAQRLMTKWGITA